MKTLSGMMLTLLLIGMLALTFNIQPVKASGTIYIRADGSVEGTTNITTADNVTYTLNATINDPIVVERSNIIIDGAGHTVNGPGTALGLGFNLTNINNATIKNTQIKQFNYGVYLSDSSNNTVSGNNITNNHFGVNLHYSSSNRFYHNNLINNTEQAYVETSGYANFWDNGLEGNYWSDYVGFDLDRNGIGDSAYEIDADNIDNYPMMGIFSDFSATSEYHVQTICNSSLSDFQFNGTAIHFNVSGENGTTGFCRICIPTGLMNDTYEVFVNGTEVSHTLLPCSNSTHSCLYFTYEHSTQEVVIVSEFSLALVLLLFMTATLLTVTLYKRKLNHS